MNTRVMGACLVLVIALLVRLGTLFLATANPQFLCHQDSSSYIKPAINLLSHGVFSQLDLDESLEEPAGPVFFENTQRVVATKGPYIYEVRRTPVYPLILAGIYGLCGLNHVLVAFVQCWLGAGTCLIVYLMAAHLGSLRAGVWAGLLAGVDIVAVSYCSMVLSETLFCFLVTAGLACFIVSAQRSDWRLLCCAGLIVGLSILCRPVALYLIPLLTLACLWLGSEDLWRRRIFHAAVFGCAACVVLAPWMCRNYIYFGIAHVTSIQGTNLYLYKSAPLELDGFSSEARGQLMRDFRDQIGERKLNYLEMSAFYQQVAMERIAQRPVRFLVANLQGAVAFVTSPGASEFGRIVGAWSGSESPLVRLAHGKLLIHDIRPAEFRVFAIAVFSLSILLTVYAGSCLALFSSKGYPPQARRLVLILAGAVVYFCVTAGPQGSARFRVPSMPPLCILAGLGLARRKRVAAAGFSVQTASSKEIPMQSDSNRPQHGPPVDGAADCRNRVLSNGTRVWAQAYIGQSAQIGANGNVCSGAFIESGAVIGDGVTIKNGALIWDGVTLHDGVFIGPNVTFTNDRHPRSPRSPIASGRYSDPRNWQQPTTVEAGASIGAGAVILCGLRIGEYAMVGAGAVVTSDVPSHAIVYGNPAKIQGWVCYCGQRLDEAGHCSTCQTTVKLCAPPTIWREAA